MQVRFILKKNKLSYFWQLRMYIQIENIQLVFEIKFSTRLSKDPKILSILK